MYVNIYLLILFLSLFREETVDFQKDEQHIIRYQPIRHLVSSSQLTLI